MHTLSTPTLGLLADFADPATWTTLDNLLRQADLKQYGQGGPNKKARLHSAFDGAREEVDLGNRNAHAALLRFVELIVAKRVRNPDGQDRVAGFDELRDALLADGYELTWQSSGEIDVPWLPSPWTYQLRPTSATEVPLAGEISALEADLDRRGYLDAINHYRQAVDNFRDHNYESSNGQLRSMLESVVVNLSVEHAGYINTGRANQGWPAINQLTRSGILPENDGGTLLKGLWSMTHTNGPHPGQSDADEASFRMQAITSTTRYLLRRIS